MDDIRTIADEWTDEDAEQLEQIARDLPALVEEGGTEDELTARLVAYFDGLEPGLLSRVQTLIEAAAARQLARGMLILSRVGCRVGLLLFGDRFDGGKPRLVPGLAAFAATRQTAILLATAVACQRKVRHCSAVIAHGGGGEGPGSGYSSTVVPETLGSGSRATPKR